MPQCWKLFVGSTAHLNCLIIRVKKWKHRNYAVSKVSFNFHVKLFTPQLRQSVNFSKMNYAFQNNTKHTKLNESNEKAKKNSVKISPRRINKHQLATLQTHPKIDHRTAGRAKRYQRLWRNFPILRTVQSGDLWSENAFITSSFPSFKDSHRYAAPFYRNTLRYFLTTFHFVFPYLLFQGQGERG